MGNGVQQYLCSAAPIPVTKDLLKDEEGIIGVRALREAESPPGAGARGGAATDQYVPPYAVITSDFLCVSGSLRGLFVLFTQFSNSWLFLSLIHI